MLMNNRKRGLFGSMPPTATPPFNPNAPMPTAMPAMGAGVPVVAQPPERKAGLGTRLLGEGWGEKLYALGGILQGDTSGVQMMQMDKRREQEAMAAAQAAQMERANELTDWRWKEDYKRAYPEKPAAPNLREDNAGNVWQFDPQTGQPMSDKPVWVDPTEKVIYQDGMQIRVPNPYRSGAGGGLDAEPTVEAGYEYTPGPGGRSNKENWKPVGGASSNASGGFPRIGPDFLG